MSWNYRIMRHVEPHAANDDQFYAMHEAHYDEAGNVTSWTQEPCCSPFGETLEEMSNDLAWIIAGLTKPVLDHKTGKEIGPAAILADDIGKVLREHGKLREPTPTEPRP